LKPDPALKQDADAYIAINAQLVEELPKFLSFVFGFFQVLFFIL